MSCSHPNVHNNCNYCQDLEPCPCTLQPILVDASVILQTLEGEHAEIAKDIIEGHLKKHIVTVTHPILGEILHRVTKEIEEPWRLEGWLKEYLPIIKEFNVIELCDWDPNFVTFMEKINGSVCRMGSRDKLHCGTAILNGISFLYFDSGINEDEDTIKEIVQEHLPDFTYRKHQLSR